MRFLWLLVSTSNAPYHDLLCDPYSLVLFAVIRAFKQPENNASLSSKQPRSCLKTSLRAEGVQVDGPVGAWTCTKRHHRARVASAVGAGTNSRLTHVPNHPIHSFRSISPDINQLSNNAPPSPEPHSRPTKPWSAWPPEAPRGTIELFDEPSGQ